MSDQASKQSLNKYTELVINLIALFNQAQEAFKSNDLDCVDAIADEIYSIGINVNVGNKKLNKFIKHIICYVNHPPASCDYREKDDFCAWKFYPRNHKYFEEDGLIKESWDKNWYELMISHDQHMMQSNSYTMMVPEVIHSTIQSSNDYSMPDDYLYELYTNMMQIYYNAIIVIKDLKLQSFTLGIAKVHDIHDTSE